MHSHTSTYTYARAHTHTHPHTAHIGDSLPSLNSLSMPFSGQRTSSYIPTRFP